MPESDSSVNNIPEKPPSPVPSLTPSSKAAGVLRSRRLRFLTGSAELCSIVAVVLLICILCGNIKPANPFTGLYFLQLDMSSIMPQDVPNSHLINTIAQSLGLRDFYQVGLWNYCEGYKPDGVTFCSAPVAMYAFNPADIIMDQLFAGATSMFQIQLRVCLKPNYVHSRSSSPDYGCFGDGTHGQSLDVRPIHCRNLLDVYQLWHRFVCVMVDALQLPLVWCVD